MADTQDSGRSANKVDDHLVVTPALYQYVLGTSLREDPVLRSLREETYKTQKLSIMLAGTQHGLAWCCESCPRSFH